MLQLEATISGDVQGVGFRYSAQEIAQSLDLLGWIKNEPDGTVRCVAAGPQEALVKFLAWLHRGPSGAYVTRVEHEYRQGAIELAPFTIR